MKNIRKNIEDLIPSNKLQFSNLWELEDLENYIKSFCNFNYGGDPTAIWKVHNFIGSLSLLEMFAKNTKD